MSKKLIIIMAAAGLVSFAGMFVFAWLTKTTSQVQSSEAKQETSARQQANLKLTKPQVSAAGGIAIGHSKMKKAMTEKQLKDLVYEMREKIQEYNNKLQGLEVQEQRLQEVQDTLKEDIEELNNLRIELASTVASLKSEQDKLLQGRVKIAKTEKKNLTLLAATYDKMDSTSAGQILTSMIKIPNSSFDDAVKILYYMTDRTKAKVLASVAETDPTISANFCQKLKQIIEKD